MKKACVLLAEGFEEVEAITPIDYLRRAGIDVTVVAVAPVAATMAAPSTPAAQLVAPEGTTVALSGGGYPVRGAHGIVVVADAGLEALQQEYDAVIAPGGMPGTKNLADTAAVAALVKRHCADGRVVAAMCAAPAYLLHGACDVLAGKSFTGFPGTETMVTGAHFMQERVVADGSIITAQAAGSAGEFAIEIVRALLGDKAADSLAASVFLA